jgi:hypothetical protein
VLAFAARTRIHRLQDGFSAAQAEERTSTVRAEFERAPRLPFDDFGKGHVTPWVMQEYSNLFDERAMVGLPTFLTTNLAPAADARAVWRLSRRAHALRVPNHS